MLIVGLILIKDADAWYINWPFLHVKCVPKTFCECTPKLVDADESELLGLEVTFLVLTSLW